MIKKKVKKPKDKVFRSYDEFLKTYFPRLYKEQKEKELTPEQLGAKAVRDILKNLKRSI
jgi:hypothetical protein